MLLGVGMVMGMLFVWAAITAIFILVWIYRAILGLREEDQLFLDPGEEFQRREQQAVISKLDRTKYLFWGSLIVSIVLGVATFGLWVFQQLR